MSEKALDFSQSSYPDVSVAEDSSVSPSAKMENNSVRLTPIQQKLLQQIFESGLTEVDLATCLTSRKNNSDVTNTLLTSTTKKNCEENDCESQNNVRVVVKTLMVSMSTQTEESSFGDPSTRYGDYVHKFASPFYVAL